MKVVKVRVFFVTSAALTAMSAFSQNADISVLISAEPVEEAARVELLTSKEKLEESAARHNYYIVSDQKVSFAVHESAIQRKALANRLWFLEKLKLRLKPNGAFNLNEMDERERGLALDYLGASYPPQVVDRLKQKGGWVFLTPAVPMLTVSDGTKQVRVPASNLFFNSESAQEFCNEQVLSVPGETTATIYDSPDNSKRSILESLNFKFLYPINTLKRKREIVEFSIDKIIEELEAQSEAVTKAFEEAMAAAYKSSLSEVQALSKGGRVSEMPESYQKQIEGYLRESYESLGFSSEQEAITFYSKAQFAPMRLDSYFSIFDRKLNERGEPVIRNSIRPAYLHRSG